MSTPLYKSLFNKGTTLYCFPSAKDKISAAYQNQNNKMYFSHFALIDFPSQQLNSGTNSNPIYFDFLNSTGNGYGFQQSISATPPASFKDQIVESLRNYVANYEETMRTSRLNNTEYYYTNSSISTPAEKIFFKWAKQLNLIDFEPANNGDQYIGNLTDFQPNNLTDSSYFPEILWTERNIIPYDIYDAYQQIGGTYSNKLTYVFQTTTNFKIGDIIEINDETNSTALSGGVFNGKRGKVLNVVTGLGTQEVIMSYTCSFSSNPNHYTGNVKLVYHKLIQHIAEINGISNVESANQSYTEVYAQVSGYVGQTPDILFRTIADVNYKPNLVFPILPSQYQPEIIGAEVYTNPIVQNPSNYPGSYYGQFDTTDFTYTTSAGDALRKSGDYYGVYGDIYSPVVNSKYIDGLSLDFNTAHYAKMNIYGREVTNFNSFNAIMINNLPPADFNFNAMLWYYTFTDINGNTTQDLYGISFFDNPDNNVNTIETGLRFPVYEKIVDTENQMGTAYDFSNNLNFDINNDAVQDVYNPNAINDLYSFSLFNNVMRGNITLNESFSNILTENILIKTQISDIKQLLYTQTDLNTIKSQIANLNKLLLLYQSNQISTSSTIEVVNITSGSVPSIELNSIDPNYKKIDTILTSNMYNNGGITAVNVTIPNNKSSLIRITNNDQTPLTLPNNNVLSMVLNSDLNYLQTIDIIVDGSNIATENKKLNIYLNYSVNGYSPVITPLISNIDLPVYYNKSTRTLNSAGTLNKFNFDIDINSPIRLNNGSILEVPLDANGLLVYNSINSGDTLVLNNFTIGTSSVTDFSGQYTVNSVGLTNSYLYMDVSTNQNLLTYGASNSLPIIFNNNINYLMSNYPYFTLNKGIKFTITRVDNAIDSSISNRYMISKNNI